MFRESLLLILLFLLITIHLSAQENPQPSPKFPIGAFLGSRFPDQNVLTSFDSSGLNLAAWHADNNTSSFLENYKVIATNDSAMDWIHYYATSYYSHWEAEGNFSIDHIGPKHKYGSDAVWHDTTCWSSLGVTAPACSLMYGPHYRQDQRHKSYYHTGNTWGVHYIPRFNLALSNPHSLNPDRKICVIKVVYRYAEVYNTTPPSWTLHDTTFLQDTLKISDFPQNGSFKIFNVIQNDTNYYAYPEKFHSTITGDRTTLSAAFTDIINPGDTLFKYEDRNSDNGIQFCVDYLGNDSTTLFIDYAEVYDENGWDEYMNPLTRNNVLNKIQNYTENYSHWDNIKYWYGQDEPYSQDSFTPIHIVDSLVQHFGGAPVTQYFQPDWRILVNGDSFMVDYYRKAKPPELIIDPYPFGITWDPVRWEDLESLRQEFQIANSLKPGFWFVGQGFGETLNGDPYIWRLPDSTELKASVMLALAHGLKGLLFWVYNSYESSGGVHVDGMVDENGNPSDVWYLLHNNFVPRLEGRLGDRLLALTYNGNYIIARYFIPSDDPSNQTFDYLTLPYNQSANNMDWHAGFSDRNGYPDDKYFFLVNLLPLTDKSVLVKVTAPDQNHINYRFRNYEGYFDTTFNVSNSNFTYTLHHPAGEGYLYEVAPVVKYGGKLYSSETINGTLDLRDDMTIENGVTLTINGTYNCYANIYTKGTGKIKTINGGTINFYNGKGIIAQGTPQFTGTSSHKLILDFNSTSVGPGITLLQGANTLISYCTLKNSVNLLSSSYSQNQTSINHTDFQNTSGYAISLSGTATKVPAISYCTFTNTDYGIFAAGQNSITVTNNTFSNNKTAISLSQISDAEIIANSFSSSYGTTPGILLNSCGGHLRANSITGFSDGVFLANSSPVIGNNQIFNNKINGIYVGTGSSPDLRAALVGNPPNQYPISGYNSIYSNGGYNASNGQLVNDDGSEIFFSNSNILLSNGCNLIADDRSVSPPLVTTTYLMNGSVTVDRLYATYNAWGDTVDAGRFGNLDVVYSPYNQTVCDIPLSGGGGLAMMNKDGVVTDTVYSAGVASNPSISALQYAQANSDMINLDFSSASTIYNTIINDAPGDISTTDAYLGLYKTARLQDADSSAMAALRTFYNSKLSLITDSIMSKIVGQLSLLTLVDSRAFTNAMNGFGDIINQDPESEAAVFAEIDAMTTSLLANNGNDSTLSKGLNKDLLV